MKVLLTIHEELNPNSGAAGSTLELGNHYLKLGHQVQYYSFNDLPSYLPARVKDLVFPEFVAFQIASLSNKQAVDVVDASTGDAWVWAKILRDPRKKRPLLVTRSHGLEHMKHLEDLEDAKRGNLRLSWQYSLYRGSFQLWEVATSLRCADLVYLLNHQEAKYAIEKLGVRPERIHVFPNGIPQAFLNLPLEPTPQTKDSAIRIAQVSTYIPRKGIQYSAPALNKILVRYPQVQVSFLGTGRQTLEDVHADFEPAVRDRIQVVQRYRHETLPTLLKGHQITLLPSLSEGFGKALIEAMACGLAPVTTATPGPLEIVRDGHDAIVVPTRDSHAIEQALERLITDHSYLEQLRHNAYATAQRYSWQRVAQERLSLYEEALRHKEYLEVTL